MESRLDRLRSRLSACRRRTARRRCCCRARRRRGVEADGADRPRQDHVPGTARPLVALRQGIVTAGRSCAAPAWSGCSAAARRRCCATCRTRRSSSRRTRCTRRRSAARSAARPRRRRGSPPARRQAARRPASVPARPPPRALRRRARVGGAAGDLVPAERAPDRRRRRPVGALRGLPTLLGIAVLGDLVRRLRGLKAEIRKARGLRGDEDAPVLQRLYAAAPPADRAVGHLPAHVVAPHAGHPEARQIRRPSPSGSARPRASSTASSRADAHDLEGRSGRPSATVNDYCRQALRRRGVVDGLMAVGLTATPHLGREEGRRRSRARLRLRARCAPLAAACVVLGLAAVSLPPPLSPPPPSSSPSSSSPSSCACTSSSSSASSFLARLSAALSGGGDGAPAPSVAHARATSATPGWWRLAVCSGRTSTSRFTRALVAK